MPTYIILAEDKRDEHIIPITCWGKDEEHALKRFIDEFPITKRWYNFIGICPDKSFTAKIADFFLDMKL